MPLLMLAFLIIPVWIGYQHVQTAREVALAQIEARAACPEPTVAGGEVGR